MCLRERRLNSMQLLPGSMLLDVPVRVDSKTILAYFRPEFTLYLV